jgi:tryptophan synthase alpha chain
MGRIEERFAHLREKGEKALIPFLTAGDPDLATTEALVFAMAAAGADIIELGVPFSDPTAEGPTIQRSSARSLAAGTSLRSILQLVARLRSRVEVPIVLMGYANPIHAMGAEGFAKSASEVGVDGVIIPDLTPEDGAPYLDPIRAAGIDVILLAAPTTRPQRLEMLVRETQGFLYYVSLQGVTGARESLGTGVEERVREAKALGETPVCVGFGVATPEHAETIGAYADGVVVGSAIVDRIENAIFGELNASSGAITGKTTVSAEGRAAAVEDVAAFIERLKKPLRR